MGPGDLYLSVAFGAGTQPAWDGAWRRTNVCVWDVAAAHLCLEDALRRAPDEVGGHAFLVSGEGKPWAVEQVRDMIKVRVFPSFCRIPPTPFLQHYAHKPVVFQEVPPLAMYIIAHPKIPDGRRATVSRPPWPFAARTACSALSFVSL